MEFSGTRMHLAPMAGVNDPVFRALCKRMGAELTYTEMISAKGLAYGNEKTKDMISSLPEDKPYAVQLFGNEPHILAKEAQVLEQGLGADLALIDINMGCPARKVARQGSGAALLQQPRLAHEIIAAVSSAVEVPVTIKMRMIEDSKPARTIDFALAAVNSGAAGIGLHGRTQEQLYRGRANREIIAKLARELPVPLIASGDVFTGNDIQEYLERGASAVMVARGAQGNPWIFANRQPSLEERVSCAREHTLALYEFEPRKLVWMRKHLSWYFKGTPSATHIRRAVQTAVTLEDYLSILDVC